MFVIVCYCRIYIDKDISNSTSAWQQLHERKHARFQLHWCGCLWTLSSSGVHRSSVRAASQCKTWFMDATFRVVNRPWLQLFTINSFIRSGTHMKQVPLMYCFMSSKRKADYYEVNMDVIDKIDKKSLYKTLECFNLFLTMKLILIIVNFRFWGQLTTCFQTRSNYSRLLWILKLLCGGPCRTASPVIPSKDAFFIGHKQCIERSRNLVCR